MTMTMTTTMTIIISTTMTMTMTMIQGEYELIMCPEDDEKRISPKKTASWEIIDLENTDKSVELTKFTQGCTLKFRLSWSSAPAASLVERPRPLMPR